MAEVPRLTIGSSAEQVECRDELITDILSRVSTSDVLKMSIVSKRWHSLIFDPDFAHTHYKNCHRDSKLFIVGLRLLAHDTRTMPERYKFRSYNSQTGSLSIYPFLWEGLDSSVENGNFELFTASNGLMCFYPRFPRKCTILDIPVFWVYNPVRKFLKKLSMPFEVDLHWIYFAEICYIQNTLKIVMAGYSFSEKRRYTLVFDSHSNSWHEGPPLLIDLAEDYYPRAQLFFNGVIYFVASIYEEESTEIKDVETLYRDVENDLLHMIIGYDVNQDQWGFSVFVPASVGYIYCLTEWEGNLLVCASNSSHRYDWRDWPCDGHFVFWILDTEHKLWIRERELDLSHEFHKLTSWIVSARGGVVWFTCGDNSDVVIVYHMKTRRCSTHRVDDVFTLGRGIWREVFTSFVIFEPTLLSF